MIFQKKSHQMPFEQLSKQISRSSGFSKNKAELFLFMKVHQRIIQLYFRLYKQNRLSKLLLQCKAFSYIVHLAFNLVLNQPKTYSLHTLFSNLLNQKYTKTKMDEDLEQLYLDDFNPEPKKSAPQPLHQAQSLIPTQTQTQTQTHTSNTIRNHTEDNDEKDIIKAFELTNKVKQLKLEIANIQNNPNPIDKEELLKKDFEMKVTLAVDGKLGIKIKCTNGFVKGVRFDNQMYPYFQPNLSQSLFYEIRSSGDQKEVEGSVYVCSYPGKQYEIRNFKIKIPKFYEWVQIKWNNSSPPESSVFFKIRERAGRFLNWIQTRFVCSISQQQRKSIQNENKLQMSFTNQFTKELLVFKAHSSQSSIQIRCDNIPSLGEMVQNLAEYCSILDLHTEGRFPKERANIKQKLSRIQEISKNKTSLSSDLADTINLIKQLVVNSENARITSQMKQLKKSYAQLLGQNNKLFLQDKKKNLNQAELQKLLKEVAGAISNFSNLRVGKYKTDVTNLCRKALKNKQFSHLIDIFERGTE